MGKITDRCSRCIHLKHFGCMKKCKDGEAFQEEKRKWSDNNWANKKFMKNLKEKFGTEVFTNRDAYEVYAEKHSLYRFDKKKKEVMSVEYGNMVTKTVKWDWEKDKWLKMNVRNFLCKAAYDGVLIRVGLGRYRYEEVSKVV